MNEKSCFFIGHRDIPDRICPDLEMAVEKHYKEFGVNNFIVGHYGDFDRLAAGAVINLKKIYSDITLEMLLPYHPGERPIEKPEGFDHLLYPSDFENIPRRYCIVRANRYMVDHVDHLIAYVWRAGSNAREVLEYAERREKNGLIRVTNLASF